MRLMTCVTLFAALIFAGSPGQALAQDAKSAVRSVISQQIDAFLADDMATAYSFASPMIKQIYPDPDRFFQMVKRGYQPVYRPGNFAFGRMKGDGAQIVQEVLIVGPDGKDYTAIYDMQRQPDGSYRINGVRIVQSAPPAT